MSDRTVKAGERVMVRGRAPAGQTYTKLPDVFLDAGESVTVTFAADAPPDPDPEPEPPPPTGRQGIWVGPAELASRPASGAAFDALPSSVSGAGNVADMGSNHDTATLGLALRAVRTNNATQKAAAVKAIESAIGTEGNQRWLDIARNLGAYVLAADLLDIRSGPVKDWIAQFLTTTQPHNNDGHPIKMRETAWNSGSNASAQAGFCHAAIAAYLGNTAELAWSWDGFRRYAGDKSSPHQLEVHSSAWAVDQTIAIQAKGATAGGCRVDGAIANDMLRGGSNICTPGATNYPWVALVGAVPAAVILQRAGFPAFAVADQALKRAAEYLKSISWGYSDQQQGAAAKHLLNVAYGLAFPHAKPVGAAMTIGYTDFTHPDAASLALGSFG